MDNHSAASQVGGGWMFVIVVVGVLLTPTQAPSQVSQTQVPRATVRELATLDGDINRYVVALPNRRALIYAAITAGAPNNVPRREDSTFSYVIATKRRTVLGTNMLPDCVSASGDQLIFSRLSEDGPGVFLWTLPIDPQTGTATGQARQISQSVTGGGRAIFSPDGKTLAFNSPRSDGTFNLTLVPSAGGEERVVANVARGGAPAWSADGRSLYVQSASSTTAIERVAIASGRIEPAIPRTSVTAGARIGLSADARTALFAQNPDRFFYWTARDEGEISVALPPPVDWGSGQNFGLESTRYLWMTQTFDQGVRVLDLTTGQVRDLLPANMQNSSPAWSPDGRRLALLSGSRLQYDITVVNADGSSLRRYRIPMQIDTPYAPSPNPDGLVWEMPWSPDGRFLAFRAKAERKNGRKVAPDPDDQFELAILDINSGQTRVLTTSSAAIGRFVWRSDGNAVRALERTIPVAGARNRWSVVEIPLNGPKRLLRDISVEFPDVNELVFTSDRTAIVRAATREGTARFVVPLDGGTTRRLSNGDTESGGRQGGTLVSRDKLLIPQVDERGDVHTITILSTVDDSTQTLHLPFLAAYSVPSADGKQLLSIGSTSHGAVSQLFLVPLDGSATRMLGEISHDAMSLGGLLSPAPDGKLLAYTSHGRHRVRIFDIDFSQTLQAIMKP